MIENIKGLSDTDVAKLSGQLMEKADVLKGKNMLIELCMVVQGFLLEFNKPILPINKGIMLGISFGESKKGCICYPGIDLESGRLLYITEWNFKVAELKQMNRKVDDIINTLQRMVEDSSKLRHVNIIGYEGVLCILKDDELKVFLAQEFIHDLNVLKIAGGHEQSPKSVSMMAIGVLDALIFLSDNGYVHENISASTVFMDNSGIVKVTDFCIVPYLQRILRIEKQIDDLPSLGALIESLVSINHPEIRDLIDHCNAKDTKASDLLDFLSKSSFNDMSMQIEKSRFETEFVIDKLDKLGKGSYGTVWKARNKLDNNLYAVKIVKLPSYQKKLCEKMIREVTLLSKLDHKYVVRYYGSWMEFNKNDEAEDEDCDENDPSDVVEFAACSLNRETRDTSTNDISETYSASNDDEARRISLFIQMTFCEGQTLRTAIDKNLYLEEKRRFTLFRQIIMGLSHIHSKGLIHRDLKPDNIFLDSSHHIRIGDFGLAITNELANRHQHLSSYINQVSSSSSDSSYLPVSSGGSQTGYVGTLLYVAPELNGNAFEATYSGKADMYSAGIIFLEMCSPPSVTVMGRDKFITAAREPEIKLPEKLLQDENSAIEVKIIKLLLDHNPGMRPESNKLLTTELVCSKAFYKGKSVKK